MLETPSTPEIPFDNSEVSEVSNCSCDAESQRLSLSYHAFVESSATAYSSGTESKIPSPKIATTTSIDGNGDKVPNSAQQPGESSRGIDQDASRDCPTSRDHSHGAEISTLKTEYFNKLRSLQNDLHQATDATVSLRRELKVNSDIVKEQADLKIAHDELQKRHKSVANALESELSNGRIQGGAISGLREHINELRKQQGQDSEIHRKALELKTEEMKTLAIAAEKDRISWEFYYHKYNHLQFTLEDDPKMRNFDQDNLLQYREKQLFEAEKNLINVSSAYESLEISCAEKSGAAAKNIQILEQDLASANEKGGIDLLRANDLQNRLKDMSNNLIKRSGEMHVPVPEDIQMYHQVAVRDNSLLTSKISALESRLQSAEVSKIASEEQCADLRSQLAQKANLEQQIRTKECENGKLRFEADALVEDHKQELMQKDGKINSLHKGITALRNQFLAQINLGLSEKAQRTVEFKDGIIQKLQAKLEAADEQLEVAKAREDKRDDIATWDRIVHNSEDRAYRNLQDRLATAETELIDLRKAREGYDTWTWQENRVLKSLIKIAERECNEDLDKAVAAVENIREARDKFSAESERFWDLGERLLQRVNVLEGRLLGKGDEEWVNKFYRENDLMQLAVGEFEDHSDDRSSDADAEERQDEPRVKHETDSANDDARPREPSEEPSNSSLMKIPVYEDSNPSIAHD